jgi:Uma2 family endonuclease
MVAQVNKPAETAIDPPIATPTRYSIEEYLALEVDAAERHEYRDGEIGVMAGGWPNHNQVAGNIYATLNFAFRGQPYQAFVTDQRLWIPQKRLYTYPDVMIMLMPLTLQVGRQDTVLNPLLIVEVLSKSTADYDRQEKFRAYRSIPSFAEYVLVDQYSQHIEHYVKTSAKKWDFQEYDATDTVVRLATISLDMLIADIYDKVEFEVVDPIS